MALDEAWQAAFATRLHEVRRRIERAARSVGREPDDVLLIGVTKTHPTAVARHAVDAGVTDLGENRVQELVVKRREVPARWHFIGRLQRNKVREVTDGATLVHSIDRQALVDAVARRAGDSGVRQPILVQVNVGDDPAKGGCPVHRVHELVAYAHAQPNLRVEGLMTMPPLAPPGADDVTAAYFATLRQLRDELVSEHPDVRHLSMGMSADLELAVENGATMVRVGTALFGPRATRPAGTTKDTG